MNKKTKVVKQMFEMDAKWMSNLAVIYFKEARFLLRCSLGKGSFAAFSFWAGGLFADFLPDLFSFLWEKWPENFSKKIPDKILQNLYYKNPRRISAACVSLGGSQTSPKLLETP